MNAVATMDCKARDLVREAAEWRLLGLLFEVPSAEWKRQVAALAAETDADDLRAAAEAAQDEASEGLHHRIFGPGGAVVPREVAYRRTVTPGRFLSELSACYQAFSYQPAAQEPPDHLAIEAGFVSYLRLKEAYALSLEEGEQATITADAARHFVDEHLRTIAQPVAQSLPSSGIRYLTLAAAVLTRLVGPAPGKEGS
jgi:nitrate reductase assembly molybdenum cofactor insertion protein NarJ